MEFSEFGEVEVVGDVAGDADQDEGQGSQLVAVVDVDVRDDLVHLSGLEGFDEADRLEAVGR